MQSGAGCARHWLLMAQMLEDLRPEPGQRVLEIGAGTGYNAALLAHVVGPGNVAQLVENLLLVLDAAAGQYVEQWVIADRARNLVSRRTQLESRQVFARGEAR